MKPAQHYMLLGGVHVWWLQHGCHSRWSSLLNPLTQSKEQSDVLIYRVDTMLVWYVLARYH